MHGLKIVWIEDCIIILKTEVIYKMSSKSKLIQTLCNEYSMLDVNKQTEKESIIDWMIRNFETNHIAIQQLLADLKVCKIIGTFHNISGDNKVSFYFRLKEYETNRYLFKRLIVELRNRNRNQSFFSKMLNHKKKAAYDRINLCDEEDYKEYKVRYENA
jgi:hypothetical protein